MQERAGQAVFRKVLLFGALAAGMVLLLDVGCIFRRVTGIPCPGCGMTRAHLAALRLDFKAAFFYHPLWPLPIPLLALEVFKPRWFAEKRRWKMILSVLLLIAALGIYAVRMILFFPDTPPMEYLSGNLLHWVVSLIRGFLRH